MKKKIKIAIIIISCIVLIVIAGDLANGNLVTRNNQNLRNALKSIKSDSIQLNAVVPFEWDVVYTFGPYASKASIKEIGGFQSTDIKENNINEGMVHLLFVKAEKVLASILGYSESLGYRLDFPSKVMFSENAQFGATAINVGLFCMGPAVPLLKRLGRKKTLELIMMGEHFVQLKMRMKV